MPEHTSAFLFLLAAVVTSIAGMGWLALSMRTHARQAWELSPTPSALRRLRWLGGFSIVITLVLCLQVDHASMAVLVWIMALSAASLLTAFVLSSRPRWLGRLAPWVQAATSNPD